MAETRSPGTDRGSFFRTLRRENEELRECMPSGVDRFAGGAKAADDLSLAVMRRSA